ncbi:IQ domain-containing protein M [Dasypus novemcinctus]|uniref:IQ domain-containing protein M n=1 Tax=Dasypus novemcinctus TaxID=9361 RepID=UPI0026602793|nr:IQ domain-containing protein M [Dasypus novemcinctus]
MDTEEPMTKKENCSTLEIIRQNFFQEAKTLIAQHYEKINEYKFQGTSVNVFRNKHQKRKSGKYIPLEIKKKEALDVVQKCQSPHKNTYFPKDLFKSKTFEEPSQKAAFKEPRLFNVKEKCKESRDLIAKEQVKLGNIVTDIESVSKKLEKEKQQPYGKSRILDTFPIHLGLPLQHLTSSSMGLLKGNDKTIYDWRGIVSRSFHLSQQSSQSTFSESSVLRDYSIKTHVKKEQQSIKPEPKPQPRTKSIVSKSEKSDNKVRRIGPHIEIFQVFREKNKFVITKKVVRMIVIVQARVRGWLERQRYKRIMTKAFYHGPSLRIVLNMYCQTIHRVRYRLGLWRTRQIINFTELEEWMDRKKFYETIFSKREDWQGLERSELPKYFNECGHFPTQKQIDETWNLVNREDHERYSELITKFKAVEMLFTLYPPQGAHVPNKARLKSTWLRPIVNGEEGYKYIATGHPILKRANIRIVGKLVTRSMRERKMKEYYKSLNISTQ